MPHDSNGTAPPALSFELYPPLDNAAVPKVVKTIGELAAARPDYVAVTYSGAPQRREATLELVGHLAANTRLRPLAHLTCVGESRASLTSLVERLIGLGVRGVLALRGDLPEDRSTSRGDLPFAGDLIELIRDVEGSHSAALCGGRLSVGVAAYPQRHPESPSFEHDVEVLLAKERSGADFAISQVYFRPGDYAHLLQCAREAGVGIPIVPGLIAFDSVRRLTRLSELAGIAPDPVLAHRLEAARDGQERRRIGVETAVELGRSALADGAPGLHLYTFNDHRGPLDVVDRLGLTGRFGDPAPQYGRLTAVPA
ncbi:MAG: methylenetetrahydrofolate reductase [Arthrobacter sp.]|uniref:methylenetetrahydrofolate reductase n=1 Tax=unclassified Arthrobacter TaxID=235627 RepID=UPI00265675D6|nr:methylenetetrahydrofolate reductase [Micrococcaceae bacterium]MDN5823292.1 methylenetetrahydrofolate reductase [Micrococcaceae bacterium]MDN5879090.1 methylenetetrahydrofolate reductase [Micrococcaceae bacterium]MDN5887317.1 methylenetetrahydrofolate reductase [Micrococcaceae bacterium]MDN5905577.1 methylenetetrahydrofolate reductase [Micrococcaceae bacterium]